MRGTSGAGRASARRRRAWRARCALAFLRSAAGSALSVPPRLRRPRRCHCRRCVPKSPGKIGSDCRAAGSCRRMKRVTLFHLVSTAAALCAAKPEHPLAPQVIKRALVAVQAARRMRAVPQRSREQRGALSGDALHKGPLCGANGAVHSRLQGGLHCAHCFTHLRESPQVLPCTRQPRACLGPFSTMLHQDI